MTQPENNDGNSAVQLTHVTRTYKRDEFEVRALDNVTLDIPRKSFVAIMGPSGSGKTTLLNMVTGIDHATSGRVAVGGEEISTMGRLEVKLSRPGGPGNGTNPEQLFAAGWSACFISSMQVVAGRMKVVLPADVAIDAEVDLGR